MGIKAVLVAIGLAMVMIMAGCASQNQGVVDSNADSSSSQYPDSTVFTGTFPCRTCSGIKVTLVLKGDDQGSSSADKTFVLDTLYDDDPTNSANQHFTGSWSITKGIPIDPNAVVVVLQPDQKNGHTYYFLRHGNDALELISPQLYPYENGSMLTLKRQ